MELGKQVAGQSRYRIMSRKGGGDKEGLPSGYCIDPIVSGLDC